MRTNYYAEIPRARECQECGSTDGHERLHIGKSSAGWVFSLRVYPDDPGLPQTWEEWKALLARDDVGVIDEYDERLTAEEFASVVEDRSGKPFSDDPPAGYPSWDAFHFLNQSEEGPRGLLRHRVGRYCLAHGEGTWDLIRGEFS